VARVRLPDENGDTVEFELDPFEVKPESDNVLAVHVKRFGGNGSTPLGRIDVKEHVYHLRHQGLADFVRWSDHTTTMGVEELILAKQNGVTELAYLDEANSIRYTITMESVRDTGFAVRREKIGWRWAVPLEMWTKRRVA
jgi:hypothetical protein